MNVIDRRLTGALGHRATSNTAIRIGRAGMAVGTLLLSAGVLHAQIVPSTTNTPTLRPGATAADGDRNTGMPPDPMQELMADKSKLARNDERQRRLVGDTERLLVLANQLKSEVAASGSETMTPLMLHQMDEIEKLARSVKEKMRN